jgi:hypothetical protein
VKVQFEFTAADLAEVAGLAADRSPLVRKWRSRAGIVWAILVGIIAYFVTPGAPDVRVAVALVLAVVLFVATRSGRGERRNARLLAFYRERLGGDGPFPCEVEITETAVVSRQLGAESRHPWSQVASISETQGGIEFIYRPMGSLLVRDRAFADAKTRADFLAQARKFAGAR